MPLGFSPVASHMRAPFWPLVNIVHWDLEDRVKGVSCVAAAQRSAMGMHVRHTDKQHTDQQNGFVE